MSNPRLVVAKRAARELPTGVLRLTVPIGDTMLANLETVARACFTDALEEARVG
jgi:hypothetical protein